VVGGYFAYLKTERVLVKADVAKKVIYSLMWIDGPLVS
jgi:hypothetical protein